MKKPCAIALRVAPFTGTFARDDATARAITAEAGLLITQAAGHGIKLEEFQFDFDCPQKKLAGYRAWLAALKPVPVRVMVAALIVWLTALVFKVSAAS